MDGVGHGLAIRYTGLIRSIRAMVNHFSGDTGLVVLLEKTRNMYSQFPGKAHLPQKIRRFLITPCLLVISLSGEAQPGKLVPERPVWGDTLQVSYNAKDQSARLSGDQPLFAKVTSWMQDGSTQWRTLSMPANGAVNNSMVVLPNTASLSVRFYTLQKDDEPAARKTYVFDKKSGDPVAGAHWEDFFTAPVRPLFELERRLHPEHYLTYAKYFNVVSMLLGADDSRKTIDSLLPVLETAMRKGPQPAAGLLAALCVGYAKSGRLAQAKPILLQLFTRYPAAAETDLAFSLYNYEYYKLSGQDVEEDIRQQLKVIYVRFPEAALSGNTNVTHYLSKEKDVPVSAFEKALMPRYANGSLSYYGLDKLPELYTSRNVRPDSAKSLLLRIISDWHTGAINHQYRLSGNHYRMYLPYLLLLLAKAELQLAQHGEAALHASAGAALVTGSNYEGNLLPDLLAARAQAYRASGNYNLALEDYKHLYKSGREDVADSIRSIFPWCSTKEPDMAALLSSLRQQTPSPSAADGKKAPGFSGTDLQGQPVKLDDLKGKIVVINFWSIGCGPCIGEMPEMNKLVDKYRNDSSVLFLALTSDSKDHLQQFFKKRRFKYRVVYGAANVQQAYAIESLPVHLVVDRQGTVIDRSIGARKDIYEYLDRVITRHL